MDETKAPGGASDDQGSPGLAPGPSRLQVVRHLVGRHQLRDSLRIGRQASLRNSALAGFQAALVCLVALPAIQLSPWSRLLPYAALGVLPALFGRFAPRGGRGRVIALACCLQLFAVMAMSLAAAAGLPYPAMLCLLALMCGVLFFAVSTWRLGVPGALIFVFAAGAAIAPATWEQLLERGLTMAAVCALSWLVCGLTDGWRRYASEERAFPAEPLLPLPVRLFAAGRIVVGSGLAAFIAHAAGAAHPAWAAIGTVAVMQSLHLHLSMNRALQRMAGTVVGAGIVWLILSAEPSLWAVIAFIALFQFVTELVIGYNYALGQIAVTPMALLMSFLAAPHTADGAAMASERVFDTLIGAGIGIVLAVLASRVDERVQLVSRGPPR